MYLHTEAGDSPASNMAFTASIKGDLQSSTNFGLILIFVLVLLPAKTYASFKVFNHATSVWFIADLMMLFLYYKL